MKIRSKKFDFINWKWYKCRQRNLKNPRDFFSWIWLYFKSLNRPLFHLGNIPRCFILLGISYSYRSVNSEGDALEKSFHFHIQQNFLHWDDTHNLRNHKKIINFKINFQKKQTFPINLTKLKSYQYFPCVLCDQILYRLYI